MSCKKKATVETDIEFSTAFPPMGPLLIKTAELLLFYAGADTLSTRDDLL
jgi:hypothetical protein